MMKFLVIDIGNTTTKFAVFEKDLIKSKQIISNSDFKNKCSGNFLKSADYIIVSSVNDIILETLKTIIKTLEKKVIYFNHKTKIPIKNKYKSKQTLGLDRLAAVVGANHLYPKKNILIFDAGTALTIDFINENSEYEGGNISPGINLRFKALNTFTSKLPLVNKNEKFEILGNDTESAILSGVMQGIINETDAYIDIFKKIYKNLTVIFTGGDSIFFEKNLKNPIFANSDLVLIGLYKVLKFNV